VLASVRQLRAPISSRLTQFLSAKGQNQQHRNIAPAISPKISEHLEASSPPMPEQEAVALAICQKHHEKLRLLFGSADAGEVVADAAAAALLKEFCSGHDITSPPPLVFVYLFRKYEPCRLWTSMHRTLHGVCVLSSWRESGMELPRVASIGTKQSSSYARAGRALLVPINMSSNVFAGQQAHPHRLLCFQFESQWSSPASKLAGRGLNGVLHAC